MGKRILFILLHLILFPLLVIELPIRLFLGFGQWLMYGETTVMETIYLFDFINSLELI